MTERKSTPSAKPASTRRKPWVTPRLDHIRAGEAENFTRSNSDGNFSFS